MYIKVYKNDFIREFANSMYANNFSNDALNALFDYFQDVESDQGEEIELDVTAIACEWSELTLAETLQAYSYESINDLHFHHCKIVISGDKAEPENCKVLVQH